MIKKRLYVSLNIASNEMLMRFPFLACIGALLFRSKYLFAAIKQRDKNLFQIGLNACDGEERDLGGADSGEVGIQFILISNVSRERGLTIFSGDSQAWEPIGGWQLSFDANLIVFLAEEMEQLG